MAQLGWHGVGHGSRSRLINFAKDESEVLVDGEWVDEEKRW
jgi:hypothetical protein